MRSILKLAPYSPDRGQLRQQENSFSRCR